MVEAHGVGGSNPSRGTSLSETFETQRFEERIFACDCNIKVSGINMEVRIEHIDDVIPYISDNKEIVRIDQENYTVIDYIYVDENTFSTDMQHQCRGLKFDTDGKIIGRPFHKFFNIGEKLQVDEIDWSENHHILEKLDGSMIHPVLIDNQIILMTRKGISDQARNAQSAANSNLINLCRYLLEAGVTPLFEFTAPDNRIVVKYDQTQLTLLSAREMVSGRYFEYSELLKLAERFYVPVVKRLNSVLEYKTFLTETRNAKGIEGYVLTFQNGLFLKIKTEDYTLRHKAMGDLRFEKNAIALFAANAIDDVVPMLNNNLASYLKEFEQKLNKRIEELKGLITDFHEFHGHKERKEYAELVFQELPAEMTAAAFYLADGKNLQAYFMKQLEAASRSSSNVEKVRNLYQIDWSIDFKDD